MNERDIRDRIGQFLKRTARTVVVPASMGLGLSSPACNGNGLRQAGDAALEAGTTQADAKATSLDLAEDAVKLDVPIMMVPYVVAMPPDAAAADVPYVAPPYLAPDAATDGTREVWRLDADKDAQPEVQPDLAAQEAARPETYKDAVPDVRADIPYPPPPYLAPQMLADELPGEDPPKTPIKK